MSLQELAPLWFAKIEKGKLNPTRKLSLAKPDRCIIGEAYGFHAGYYIRGEKEYCRACANMGNKLCDYASTARTFDRKYVRTAKFDSQLKRFVTHFTKVHKPKNP
jgi:hypothetical protein